MAVAPSKEPQSKADLSSIDKIALSMKLNSYSKSPKRKSPSSAELTRRACSRVYKEFSSWNEDSHLYLTEELKRQAI